MTANRSYEPNTGTRPITPGAHSEEARSTEGAHSDEARLSQLEAQVRTLADAVRTLAQGLEKIPTRDESAEEAARGARLAHELLLAQGL
ncbi:hypothetical protein AB0I10_18610 [Streptomyces sp. NPDC050636]|uniref:hypothetical protein n=1 Tax=Streptomyces sp. NPDC050636 TaxID=3154510 RepID=UPI00344A81BB